MPCNYYRLKTLSLSLLPFNLKVVRSAKEFLSFFPVLE